jgi:hypothetical protein
LVALKAQSAATLTSASAERSSDGALWQAEDALQLVHLYAERGSPKYEKAARRWLERYLTEGTPRLQHFAEVAADLASREM